MDLAEVQPPTWSICSLGQMTAIEELAARLDRVEAELALHWLPHGYCVGADHRDRVRWEAVWTADAVWETSPEPDRIYTGIEAIYAAVERRQWQAFPHMQHATANHVVTTWWTSTATGAAGGRTSWSWSSCATVAGSPAEAPMKMSTAARAVAGA